MALTDTEIRRSRPAEKPYKLSDSGGLHLLVTSSGGRLWRWKYRFQSIEKQMSFGSYPALSLADARERRDAARKRLATGIDPIAERMAKKTAIKAAPSMSARRI
jgi:Arm domain-containing DNA-binding protein